MTSPPAPSSALDLIRRGPFARLWWAGLISSTGDWITIFATLAVADQIAGGAGTLVAVVSRVVPGLVFGAVVGVIADRVDRRKLLVIADVGRALLVPFLAFVTDLPTLVALNLALEFLSLLGQSPRSAVLPSLVRPEDIVTANSLTLGAAYGTVPLAAAVNFILDSFPPLGLGGLIPPGNTEFALAFFFDSVTFLASGALVYSLPAMAGRASRRKVRSRTDKFLNPLRDLVEGAVFLWRQRTVRRVIAGMTAALAGGGVIVVLGIRFVDEVLRADTRGFFAVVAALGLGAGIGIGAVSLYSSRLLRHDLVFGVSMLAAGVGLAAAAFTETVAGASAWMLFMGLGAGAGYVMGISIIHEEVTDELRGRTFAALFSLMRIGLFVSMAVAVPLRSGLARAGLPGPFADATRAVVFLGGALMVVTALFTLWSIRHVFMGPKVGAETHEMLERASRLGRPLRTGYVPDPEEDE